MKSNIEIYKSPDGATQVEVKFEEETVWLSQKMMSELFDKDSDTIGLHLKNIYIESELDEEATAEFFSVVQSEGKRQVKRDIKFYNLDAIISVGYRVNSKRGTQFRQWATKRLKEYLLEGYSINQKRLAERNLELQHLKAGISILRRSIEQQARSLNDAKELAALLDGFSHGLSLLDDYDHERLDQSGNTSRSAIRIEADEYRQLVKAMRSEFSSELFGKEKDGSFDSSASQIYQSFGGSEHYPSLEEKAAMLLYLVVKNHTFIDGNKRIAAACFLYFLEKNGLLYMPSGETIISDDALASITLFIAESKPDEMRTVKQVVISLLNRKGNKK